MSAATAERVEERTTASGANAAASPVPLPLEGVRIVDFTQVFMGPSCTQLLGDYGADIIKVERPGAGDISRNSRFVSVDTRSDDGREVLQRLLADADVVVSNFRSGVMER
ncbi:MAG: CoA transferase, partial [Arthrobacter sp.]